MNFLIMIKSLCILLLLLSSCSQKAGLDHPDHSRPRVITWIPHYAIESSQKSLNQSVGDIAVSQGLSHLSLQFWIPGQRGTIKRVDKYDSISEDKIRELRNWARARKVNVMLCIYNGTSSWDWTLAETAFDNHQDSFIDALMAELKYFDLDGIDIDLEGKGKLNDSKPAFIQFIKKLSYRLHKEDKTLTVCSFAHKWNVPNRSWWADLLPHVDALNVMGYSETAANGKDWRSYSELKKAAGPYAHKLLIGMPSHQGEWQNTSLQSNLDWLLKDADVGLAFWDAQLKNSAWRKKETWDKIKKIRNK